jgi:hypothetical protein
MALRGRDSKDFVEMILDNFLFIKENSLPQVEFAVSLRCLEENKIAKLCILFIYENFTLSMIQLTSIPTCRDAPCNETDHRYFKFKRL